MSQGQGDNWLQSFFPGWRGEKQLQGIRNNAGSSHPNPHPAFADAAQIAEAAHADYVQFQQSRSPQARAAYMNQQATRATASPQGMKQTLFRSQLNQHASYEHQQQHPPDQAQQQPRLQAQNQDHPQYQPQHRSQQQHPHPSQHRAQQYSKQQPPHHARQHAQYRAQQQEEWQEQQPAQQPAEQQVQYHGQARYQVPHQSPQSHHANLQHYSQQAQHQHQAQFHSDSLTQQEHTQAQSEHSQHRDAAAQHQYVRPSDITPAVSYYQPNPASQSYTHLPPMQSSVPMQRPASRQAIAQPSPQQSQSPIGQNSRLPTVEAFQRTHNPQTGHSAVQQSPSLTSAPAPPSRTTSVADGRSSPATALVELPQKRAKTNTRAPASPHVSFEAPEISRQGSFLEQGDPDTSSSRSTLEPQARSVSHAPTTMISPSISDGPPRSPVVSHSQPPPQIMTSASGSDRGFVSTTVSVPTLPRISDSITPSNSKFAAAARNQPSVGPSTTSASVKSQSMSANPRGIGSPSVPSPQTANAALEGSSQCASNTMARAMGTSLSVQLQTPGSPSALNPMPGAAGRKRPSQGIPTTSASVKSPSIMPVSNVISQPLRPYVTPEMLSRAQSTSRAATPRQISAETSRSAPAPSASPSIAASAWPAMPPPHKASVSSATPSQRSGSIPSTSAPPMNTPHALSAVPQTCKANSCPQPSTITQTAHITLTTRAPSVNSGPTVPAAPQVPMATISPQNSAPASRNIPASSASPLMATATAPVQPIRQPTAPPQRTAETNRSTTARSASSVDLTAIGSSASQVPAATVPPRTAARTAPSASVVSAPPDNFAPFKSASTAANSPRSVMPTTSRPATVPSRSIGWESARFPSQGTFTQAKRKRGRPPKYPAVTNPQVRPIALQNSNNQLKSHAQSVPRPNVTADQYQRTLSGPPNHPNDIPANAPPSAELAASSYRRPGPSAAFLPRHTSHPNTAVPAPATASLGGRSEPALHRFAAGPHTPSRGVTPTGISQSARGNHSSQYPARILQVSARETAPGPARHLPAQIKPRSPSLQQPPAKMRKLDDGLRHAVTSSPSLETARLVQKLPTRKALSSRDDIVLPVSVTDILIKDAYDPATIARDILIVADKHPTEKGLNHHLHSLRRNFQAVDYTSDLATFRWDIVDPYVNYPPSILSQVAQLYQAAANSTTTKAEPTSQPSTAATARPAPGGVGHGVPHLYPRDGPTPPVARPEESPHSHPISNTNTVTASTSTTSTSAANASTGTAHSSLNIPSSASSGKIGVQVSSSTLGATNTENTFAPSPQASSTLTSTSSSTSISTPAPASVPRSERKPISIPPSTGKQNAFGALPFKPPSFYSPLHPTAQPLPYSLPPLPSAPSSQNTHSSRSAESQSRSQIPAPPSPAALASLSSVPAPKPSPKRSGPSKSESPSTPKRGSVRPNSQSPRGKIPQQSPLPKGLPEPQVVIPVSPQVMAPPKRKPGRPPKKDIQVEVTINNRPPTTYQVFRCKWIGCSAQLHNLQAIQTHILGVHIPHHIVCAWEDCNDKAPRAAAVMWEHVGGEHIKPLAWQLGDGPAASGTDMSNQDRHDTMTLPADRDSIKIFSRIHGTQTCQQKAQTMEEGGRRWKEEAGPDADISDRPLSTPPRLVTSHHTETAYTVSDVSVVI